MARVTDRLTALGMKRAKKPGYYSDGGGLYLQVSDFGTKSWVFRYTSPTQVYPPEHKRAGQSKPRELGIGSAGDLGVSLAAAREIAQDKRDAVAKGIDPVDDNRARKATAAVAAAKLVTFRQATQDYIDNHKAGWRVGGKYGDQWENPVRRYAYPVLGSLPVQSIDQELVLKVVRPLWQTKTKTAKKLCGQIAAVISFARPDNDPTPNPADLTRLLKTKKLSGADGLHSNMATQYYGLDRGLQKASIATGTSSTGKTVEISANLASGITRNEMKLQVERLLEFMFEQRTTPFSS